jgi:signal transduction histidine kinase/CheY-like chemotaxis protein
MFNQKQFDSELTTHINIERHKQFMEQALAHLVGGLLTSMIILYLYKDTTPQSGQVLWLGLNLFLLASTVLFYSVYYIKKTSVSTNTWAVIVFVVSMIWGCVWATAPFIFLQTNDSYYIALMAILLIALSTTPAPALVHYLPAYYVFITIPLAALTVRLYDTDIDRTLTYLIPFLWLMLLMYGWKLNETMIESIRLRLENEKSRKVAEIANLAKSKFLAAASHDIRQPLQAAHLFLSALADDLGLDKEQQDESSNRNYRLLDSSISDMSNILNSLLDVSKLDADVITPKPKHLFITESTEDICRQYEAIAKKQGLKFSLKIDNLVGLYDPVLLNRVMNNLLSNAMRYTEYGEVSVVIKQVDNKIRISVSDTGRGIPELERKNIFMEFHQLHNPERNRDKGLGLGLSIVQRLCALQEWELSLTSNIGQGSTFSITLPRGNLQDIVKNIPLETTVTLANTNIIVIENDENIRIALTSTLEKWGCHVKSFSSEAMALAHLDRAWVPNLIISDYRLNEEKTGIEAIKAIEAYYNHKVTSIIVTGDTDPARVREATNHKLTVLQKPIKPPVLRSVIQKKLAQPA